MKHRFTLLFALLCASMMTWAAEWTGQVTGTATNVRLDGIGSNENRTEVNYTVNYLVEYNAGTLTITLGYTEDNFNKTVGLVPQVFVNGVYKGNFGGVTWSSTDFASGQVLDIHFFFAYNKGSSNSSHFSYTIPSDGGGGGTEPGVIDWNTVNWLGNGIVPEDEEYNNKYKAVVTPVLPGTGINNLQTNKDAKSIHIAFPSAEFGTISLSNSQYHTEGAGMFVHLDAFTYKQTEFTIENNGTTYTFTVYYADGQEGSAVIVPEIYDVNFALASNGSTATASSGSADLAIDGNEGTRWESAQTDDETYTLDMGQLRVFNTVKIKWEGAYCSQFELTYSTDGITYLPLYTETNLTSAGWQTIEIEKTTARYIKYHGTKRATGYGQSFYEFQVLLPGVSTLTTIDLNAANTIAKVGGEGIALTAAAKDQNSNPMSGIEITYEVTPTGAGSVVEGKYIPDQYGWATIVAKSGEVTSDAIQVFGLTGENLALNKPATAGANETPVAEANDASLSSFWSLGPNKTEDKMWWRVDLEDTYNLSLVIIKWEGACPTEHAIQVSTDDTNWTDAATLSGWPEIGTATDHKYQFYSINSAARYIRVKASALRDKGWGMKIYDFQAFGTLAATPTKTVSASVNDATMGTATVKQGGVEVTEVTTGSEVTFNAVANDGYVFVEWSNGEKNATFTTTVDAALNLTATFRQLGTTYCNTLVQSTNGGQEHDAYVTMKRTAENEYTLVVRSAEAMQNFGGTNFYMQPNTHVIDLRDQGILSTDKRTLIATFSAEKEPYMTTPLYVVLDGEFEAHFPLLTDIEFAVSCEDPEITAMVLNHSTAVLETGNTITLEPIFTPTFMSADITWETSNADVATVSNGIVTAVGAGEATITAKVSETIKATCIITVQTATAHNWYGYATDHELDYTYRIEYTTDHHIVAHVKRQGEKVGLVDATMFIGDKLTYINNIEGEEEGWKKGVTEQTYTIGEELNILIQSDYAGESSKIYINYIVGSDNTMPTIEPSQLSLNTNSLTLGVSDEDIQLVAEIHHCDAANKTLTWTSSNEAAVTVVDGKVHPVEVGTATITATTYNGISATCEVTVVGALEPATWYGTAVFKVNGNPVAVNYSITRTSDRKLTYRTVLSETVTGMSMQLNDGEYRLMTQDETGRIAEWTSTNTYLDGATHFMFFYPAFDGGADRWDVNYTVGSSNEKPNTLVAFGDQADNTAKIVEYADEVVDAHINRTFPNTDEWYTLCLPFDMDEAQLAATFGAGYTLATLGGSEDRGSLIHLNFDYVNTLDAGKPYLLRPGVSTTIVPMIEDVTIKSAAPQKAESTHMQFQGTFAPTTLEGDNKRFVGPNNYLYSPAEGGTNMKSFRCYFTIPVESQALVGSKAARIVFGPQVTTGTENVQSDQVQSTKVMIDGTLYIIRGERTYNAQGQLVK